MTIIIIIIGYHHTSLIDNMPTSKKTNKLRSVDDSKLFNCMIHVFNMIIKGHLMHPSSLPAWHDVPVQLGWQLPGHWPVTSLHGTSWKQWQVLVQPSKHATSVMLRRVWLLHLEVY